MKDIQIYTQDDLVKLRAVAKLTRDIRDTLGKLVVPGASPLYLDSVADRMININVATSACKGYTMQDLHDGYPATVCISVNDVAAHGIPTNKQFENGDMVNIDLGVIKDGFVGDVGATFFAGTPDPEYVKFDNFCRDLTDEAVELIKPGVKVSSIGKFIFDKTFDAGYSVLVQLAGHGIGKNLHEAPLVWNVPNGDETVFEEGMCLCVEPVLSISKNPEASYGPDGWSIVVNDGAMTTQFERQVYVTSDGVEILA